MTSCGSITQPKDSTQQGLPRIEQFMFSHSVIFFFSFLQWVRGSRDLQGTGKKLVFDGCFYSLRSTLYIFLQLAFTGRFYGIFYFVLLYFGGLYSWQFATTLLPLYSFFYMVRAGEEEEVRRWSFMAFRVYF